MITRTDRTRLRWTTRSRITRNSQANFRAGPDRRRISRRFRAAAPTGGRLPSAHQGQPASPPSAAREFPDFRSVFGRWHKFPRTPARPRLVAREHGLRRSVRPHATHGHIEPSWPSSRFGCVIRSPKPVATHDPGRRWSSRNSPASPFFSSTFQGIRTRPPARAVGGPPMPPPSGFFPSFSGTGGGEFPFYPSRRGSQLVVSCGLCRIELWRRNACFCRSFRQCRSWPKGP
jgi:hypothetical protein